MTPEEQLLETLLKFGVVGASGLCIDFFTTWVCKEKLTPTSSFTAGVLASYKLNKKFSLTSGISFSNSMISITATAVSALQDQSGIYKFKLPTTYGFAEISKPGILPMPGDSLLVSDAVMQFSYISFPLIINYNLGGNKLQWSVHAGAALNKVVSDKVKIEYEYNNSDDNETVNKIEGVRKTFISVNTGLEAAYTINPSMAIAVRPELRYGINAINKGTPVKTYPINYGVSLNLHLNF